MIGYCLAGGRGRIDILMRGIARTLTARGLRLSGAVQENSENPGSVKCDMDLRVLPQGPIFRISQNNGPGASGCRLDAGGLENAVAAAQRQFALDGLQPDLLVINKFGKQECLGRGFRPLIAQAILQDIPVLVGVNNLNQADFLDFVGDMATRLPARRDAVLSWVEGALAPR